jgi:hypothetical protein
MAVQTQIQTRRGTAASWTSTNPTLAAGEIGFETDTGKFKIGNGSTAWASLAYSAGATAVTYLFNATAGQTTFSGTDANGLTLAYTVGAEQVYLNGVLQVRGSDYTATNGTSIVLASGALVSDVLNIIAYSAMTITDTYTQAQADAKFYQLAFNGAAGKNAVINGGMDIWQRGTSTTWISTNSVYYAIDRWQAFSATTDRTVTRQLTNDTTNLPNIQYCARFQRTSGNTNTSAMYLTQNFETVNSIPYAGKTVTFSFYARKGANYSATSSYLNALLIIGTGTDENVIYPGYTANTQVINQNATLTTTWQRFSYTGTIPTTATEMCVQFGANITGTAGAADYFEVTGVQLELGSIATPFARTGGTIQGELAACQRYYWRATSNGTTATVLGGASIASSTSAVEGVWKNPVTMRVSPTSLDGANLAVLDVTASRANVTTATISGDSCVEFSKAQLSGASGLTSNRSYLVYNQSSATGYIGFSAEL